MVALIWSTVVSAQPAGGQDGNATSRGETLDLDESIVESSPALQRWLEETPDLREDIRRDPAFRTRLRLGYLGVDGGDGDSDGILVGVEDIMLTRSGLTLSADYRGTLSGDRYSTGGELRYYLLPLGRRVNLAPVLGYRGIRAREALDGVAVGARLLLIPSRTGAADLSLAQTLVNPGGREEASLFTVSAGYALTQQLRVAGDIRVETVSESDTQMAVVLEWLL